MQARGNAPITRTFTVTARDAFALELRLEALFHALAKQRCVVTKTSRSPDWQEASVEYAFPQPAQGKGGPAQPTRGRRDSRSPVRESLVRDVA